MAILAQDLFTDSNGIALQTHTPTTTWTSWAQPTSGPTFQIQSNRARQTAAPSTNQGWAQVSPAITADAFRAYVDMYPVVFPASTGYTGGLGFRGESINASTDPTRTNFSGFAVLLAPTSGTSGAGRTAQFAIRRYVEAASDVTNTISAVVALPNYDTLGRRIVVEVLDAAYTVRVQPAGGGADEYTYSGDLNTLFSGADDYNDTNHRFFFLDSATGTTARIEFDNYTVESLEPTVPTALQITSQTATSVSLSWSASTFATGYKIYRTEFAGGPLTLLGTSATTTYTDNTVLDGEEWWYYVSATNSQYESDTSAPVWSGGAIDEYLGLDHLEGEAVSIVNASTGAVIASPYNPLYTEVRVLNGAVYLPDQSGASVIVGLPMVTDIQTLDVDAVSTTIKDKGIFVGGVKVWVENTGAFYAGPKEPTSTTSISTLERQVPRDDEGYEVTELDAGVVSGVLLATWNNTGRVFIRQVDPVPMTVLAISPQGLFSGR